MHGSCGYDLVAEQVQGTGNYLLFWSEEQKFCSCGENLVTARHVFVLVHLDAFIEHLEFL